MRRTFLLIALVAAFALLPVHGQEPEPADPLMTIRASLEEQNRRINALASEVARLSALLEKEKSPDVSQALPATAVAMPADPQSGPGSFLPGTGPEPAHTGITHVVKKGENLTNIAKQYNVPVGALATANRIEDARKLQIGQVLNIPQPTPSPTPNTLDKETP